MEERSCVTDGGPGRGNDCIFPFTVGGQTFSQCTKGKLETGCVTATYFGFLTVTTCQVSTTSRIMT